MILLIDNYDSFVFNLARYFQRLGQEVCVLRNDVLSASEIRRLEPTAIVVSPGPCSPREAGNSLELVRTLHTEIPLLGVCLGHQVIAEALGGLITRAPEPMHGRVSTVHHTNSRLFADIPATFAVCRYHSLQVDPESLPTSLNVTATTPEGIIMAVEHVEHPVVGVQFHPEAALTQYGYQLLKNFLGLAGIAVSADVVKLAANEFRLDRPVPQSTSHVHPHPVTF